MKIGRKDHRILMNGPVLNNDLGTFLYFDDLAKAIVEEVHLQVERPARHVFVEVVEVRIVLDVFKLWQPTKVLGENLCKRGFAGAYVPCNGNMLYILDRLRTY